MAGLEQRLGQAVALARRVKQAIFDKVGVYLR